jgi:hypothetical protein
LSSTTTILPWHSLVAASASLAAFPSVPTIGIALDTSIYRAHVDIIGAVDFAPEQGFSVIGGEAAFATILRGVADLGVVGFAFGGRAGYLGSFALVSEHYIEVSPGERVDVTLLPSYLVHGPSVGAGLSIGLLGYARASLDIDVLPYLFHKEEPTDLGTTRSAFGGRAAVRIDLFPLFGVLVSFHARATAFDALAEGVGTRINRKLDHFRGGEASVIDVDGGIGLGYRF